MRRRRVISLTLLVLTLTAAACGSPSAAVQDAVGDASAEAVTRTDIADRLRVSDASSLATALEGVDFEQITAAAEFTVFAPNDEAFLALTADQTAELLSSPETVVGLVKLHVVPEPLDGAALADRSSVTTAAGTTLEITNSEGRLTVGGATVISHDGELLDGAVVHIIDQVLLP